MGHTYCWFEARAAAEGLTQPRSAALGQGGMSAILHLLLPAMIAIGAWGATEFVARPLRRFFDLRSEIRRKMIQYANVLTVREIEFMFDDPLLDDGAKERARLAEAVLMFRDLHSQMMAFGQTETLAAWAVKRLGFNPNEGGRGLIRLSDALDSGEKPLAHQMSIDAALKLTAP